MKKLLQLILILGIAFFATPLTAGKTDARVWVKFTKGHKGSVQKALKSKGAVFHYDFDTMDSFVVTMPAASIAGFSKNPGVEMIEEDAPRYLLNEGISHKKSGAQRSVQANNQSESLPYGIDKVQARDVWDADRDGIIDAGAATGAGRKVCIIDTGLHAGHEDLQGINVSGMSLVDNNNDWASDGAGHGTHVAGTINASFANGMGVTGVSPGKTDLYIVKIFDNSGAWTNSSDLVAAIYACKDAGAHIVSMSLGGTQRVRSEEREFAKLADRFGMLFIAAAGNDGNTRKSYPASYSAVVSVAATDSNNQLASFSQRNSAVEIAAPGVGIWSTVPFLERNDVAVDGNTYTANHIDFAAHGTVSGTIVSAGLCDGSATPGLHSGKVVLCERGTVSFVDKVLYAQNSGANAVIISNNEAGNFFGTLGDGSSSTIPAISISQADGQFLATNKLNFMADVTSLSESNTSGYAAWDGTSMATPHVSGVAALIWSANTTWTNNDIRNAMQQTALDLGATGRDDSFGYGLVQAASAITYLGGGTLPPPSENNAPSVTITSPTNGQSSVEETTIQFTGSATDQEDGDLTATIIWVSDRDGNLGTGGSVTRNNLSIGTHTITASVTDLDGLTSTTQRTFTVTAIGGGTATVIAVTTDAPIYQHRDTVTITAAVTDGANAIVGMTVNVTIKTPKGKTYAGNATSDANGQVQFTFSVNAKKDGYKTYTVAASADGETATTTFEVQ